MNTRKYLVADDSETQRSLGKRALMGLGVPESNIIETSDGQETLDRILEGDVGMVLLDITMPGRSGLEILAEWILAENCNPDRLIRSVFLFRGSGPVDETGEALDVG